MTDATLRARISELEDELYNAEDWIRVAENSHKTNMELERQRRTVIEAELCAAKVRIGELEKIEVPVQINIDEKAKVRIGELENYRREAENCITRYAHECDVIKSRAERAEARIGELEGCAIFEMHKREFDRAERAEAALSASLAQCKTLGEALKFYANKSNWVSSNGNGQFAAWRNMAHEDCGDNARAALAQVNGR